MDDQVDNLKEQNMENASSSTYVEETVNEISISYMTKNYLIEIGKWTKFISILGFIAIGLMVVAGLFMSVIFSALIPREFIGDIPFPMGAFGGVYMVMAAIYFFPVYYLFMFSTKINAAIKFNDHMMMEIAFKNLKSHYKFIGILMIVMMSLYFVAGIGGFIAASMFYY